MCGLRIISLLFDFKTNFKKILKNKTEEDLNKWIERAVEIENYALAAYIKHYIEIKFKKKA